LRPGDEPEALNEALSLLLVRQPCVPAARLSGAVPAANVDEARRRFFSGLPAGRIVWEGGPDLEKPEGTAKVVSWLPSHWKIETKSSGRAALVVAQAFSMGWRARIDGAPAPILPVDVVLQGIDVPQGSHEVELDYSVPRGREGIALSIVGAIVCAVLALIPRRTA
jgi:hypothetical protein